MSFTRSFQRSVALLSAAVILAGCVNAPRNNPNPTTSGAGEDPCSVASSALVGAGVGLLLGAMTGGKRGALKGGAIGGAVGAVACVAVNVQSRQTKTAAQVDHDYRMQRGALSPEPSVVTYQSQVNTTSVQRGQPFQVNSVVELANGSLEQVRSVREELVVFTPDGSPIKAPTSKPFIVSTAGRFENSFELKLPPGLSQGTYNLKTQLFVNDKPAATRDLRTQVVWNGTQATVVAAR